MREIRKEYRPENIKRQEKKVVPKEARVFSVMCECGLGMFKLVTDDEMPDPSYLDCRSCGEQYLVFWVGNNVMKVTEEHLNYEAEQKGIKNNRGLEITDEGKDE